MAQASRSLGLFARYVPCQVLADWIYPTGCVICGRECHQAIPICKICCRRLPSVPYPLCPVCGHFVPGKQPHRDCLADEWKPSLLWICGIFDMGYRSLVHALKYEHQQAIGRFFGRRLGRQLGGVSVNSKDRPLIVPVPLHRTREKHRGYNQSSAIAAGLGRMTGFAVKENLLFRVRRTRDQTKLSPEKRRANVRDAFRVTPAGSFHGRRVILIDDVTTTGATLAECARVCVDDGAVEVQAAVIALARPAKLMS